jgi:hypothetical protein
MVLEEYRAEDCVKDLGAKVVQSLLGGDTSSLSELLDEGFVLRMHNGERISKEEWLRLLATRQIHYDSLSVEFAAVHVYDGQVAFLSGYTESEKTYRGRRVAGSFPFTALYVCRRGNWQIVAIHQIEDCSRNRAAARASV